jgi:hypothetical protein
MALAPEKPEAFKRKQIGSTEMEILTAAIVIL